MFKPYIGGRGHHAPYETTHLRVPVEIKPYLEKLIATYKFAVRMQDTKVLSAFVKSLKDYTASDKPIEEESIDSSFAALDKELSELRGDLTLAQSTIRKLQNKLNLIEANNKEAKKILENSLELPQVRSIAVKKEVKRALNFID